MYISYERVALCGLEDPDLRLTFDSHILWRDSQLELSKGSWGQELLEPGVRLMEIKIAGAMPLWLGELLDELTVYPISFSKYGRAYQKRAAQKTEEKGGQDCA